MEASAAIVKKRIKTREEYPSKPERVAGLPSKCTRGQRVILPADNRDVQSVRVSIISNGSENQVRRRSQLAVLRVWPQTTASDRDQLVPKREKHPRASAPPAFAPVAKEP